MKIKGEELVTEAREIRQVFARSFSSKKVKIKMEKERGASFHRLLTLNYCFDLGLAGGTRDCFFVFKISLMT